MAQVFKYTIISNFKDFFNRINFLMATLYVVIYDLLFSFYNLMIVTEVII